MTKIGDILEHHAAHLGIKDLFSSNIHQWLDHLKGRPGYVTIHDASGDRVGVLIHALDFDKIEDVFR